MKPVMCPQCGMHMHVMSQSTTLVAYQSPPGHNHDDNCVTRVYMCEGGHRRTVSRINRCGACEWYGKTKCFCCGDKVGEWPEDETT